MAARGTRSAGTGILALALLSLGLSLLPAGATPPPGSTETKLAASDGAPGDQFGHAVAADGDTIVVGAPGDDDHGSGSGAAYVFTPDELGRVDEVKLTAWTTVPSAGLGSAVAIDGDTIVVGAPGMKGEVYVFTRTGPGQYSRQLISSGTGPSFGGAVAVDGDTIVVGAVADSEHGLFSGALFVYTPDGAGGYDQLKLTASDNTEGTQLGVSVAIEGGTIVAGALAGSSEADGVGSVYVFSPDGAGGYTEVELSASDPMTDNGFGRSVAIHDGSILVGAHLVDDSRYVPGGGDTGRDVGAAYLYEPDGSGGYSETKIVSSDSVRLDHFGNSVGIEDGEVVVGAEGNAELGLDAGAAYRYRSDGVGGYAEAKITSSDGAPHSRFGSVAIEGGTIMVGAFRADGNAVDSGAVYVYEPPRDPVSVLAVPCPLYDSTTATGVGLGGALAAGELRTVAVTGPVPAGQGVGTAACVPAGATAAVVTISAVDPQGSGNLRLSPAGVLPNGGVVNYAAGPLHNANTVTVPLSAAGEVDVFANAAATDVRLVAVGYTLPSALPGAGLHYNGLTPCAVADSRPNQGPTGANVGPFAGGAAYPDIDVVGTFPAAQGGGNTDCGVPAGADALLVNLVAVNATGGTGYLSAATGGLDPVEAVTPFADLGMNNAATTIVPLNGGETVAIDIDAVTGTPSVHVRAVVLGYYDEIGDGFTPLTGCAAFDSRPGFGGSGAFVGKRPGGSTTTYQITGTIPTTQGGNGGHCGVPPGATAVLINLVAVQPDEDGNLRAYATGATPTGGVLNFASVVPALNNSNAVVVRLSPDGQIDVFTNTATNDGTPATHVRGVILGYLG